MKHTDKQTKMREKQFDKDSTWESKCKTMTYIGSKNNKNKIIEDNG